MRSVFSTFVVLMAWIALGTSPSLANPPSPELVQQIQSDLATLGYDPGAADGQLVTKTQLAIGQFEADHGLPFTGTPSLELAFKIRSAIAAGDDSTSAPATAAPAVAPAAQKSAAELQQECLQQAQQQQQQGQQEKKKWGALSNLGNKLANRFGGYEVAKDVHDATSTVKDVSEVAKEFGISEAAAAECMNPS